MSEAATPALREQILSDPSLILEDHELMRALLQADRSAQGRNVVDLRGVLVDQRAAVVAAGRADEPGDLVNLIRVAHNVPEGGEELIPLPGHRDREHFAQLRVGHE